MTKYSHPIDKFVFVYYGVRTKYHIILYLLIFVTTTVKMGNSVRPGPAHHGFVT